MIDYTSSIGVSPFYHFSMVGLWELFLLASQIQTFENRCEKWKEKYGKILWSIKEICNGDCEVDAWRILFIDVRGAVCQHIVPRHTTINALYYREVLRTLKRHANKKRLDLKIIGFCTTTTLSYTLLPLSDNFLKSENLKFSHTPCTVSTLPYVMFGFLES